MATKSKGPPRQRIGRVSLYPHHGKEWLYYRENGQAIRRPAGVSGAAAEAVASLINARLAAAAAKLDVSSLAADWLPGGNNAAKSTTTAAVLQSSFLDHHENGLASARGTVDRYRTATNYFVSFVGKDADPLCVDVAAFVTHLRRLEISPNGHPNTAKRRLRDKGLLYILQTCRSMLRYGQRHGLLDETARNPFSTYPISRIVVRDRKPVFIFTPAQEEAFFRNARGTDFALQMVLAKTGQRPAELTHTFIEDLDLDGGWWHVRSKPEIGWTTKTNRERAVPLANELVVMLKAEIGHRMAGLVFTRRQMSPLAGMGRAALGSVAKKRLLELPASDRLDRRKVEGVYRSVWFAASEIDTDKVRSSFIQIARAARLPEHATCTKSWRHTFATLLQQANVDVLIRQETLGHKPTDPSASALGMTGVYTHTDPATQHEQITRALRHRPQSLSLIAEFIAGILKGV